MEFKTDAQKACYAKVAAMMKELFGAFATVRDDRPAFGVQVGSAYATATVYPWGTDDACIAALAWVVTKVELTPDLLDHLLRENYKMRFGAFSIDPDGDVAFEYAIVGGAVDKEELRAAVMAVLTTADKYDDEIIARWGGQRAVDRAG